MLNENGTTTATCSICDSEYDVDETPEPLPRPVAPAPDGAPSLHRLHRIEARLGQSEQSASAMLVVSPGRTENTGEDPQFMSRFAKVRSPASTA